MLRKIPGKVRRYRAQLVELLETGTKVYRAVSDLPGGPPPDAIRLVHISDVHLSPFAFPPAAHEHGTTTLVQGSTGGSGLRGVQVEPSAPVSLSVLHIDRTSRTLWGVDEVTLDGLGGLGMSVVRRPLDALLAVDTSRVAVRTDA